jgi:hypothetical protein
MWHRTAAHFATQIRALIVQFLQIVCVFEIITTEFDSRCELTG